jgi:multiple sugar transport system ATP-binding protein
MGRVALTHVTKRFGKVVAVDDVTLDIADGEFLVLLGPSGCGKSTALRMIAGLEDPSDGVIEINERMVNGVEPKDRDVAMVFQSYALYPHLTVRRNIEFPLRTRDVERKERKRLVDEAATTLGLLDLLERKPAQLSGGQRQRVALARAIVRHPAAFLMDEPLSNLDAKLRVQTRAELVALQKRLGTTTIYVTHDQVEAMTMGDRIAILRDGRVQQVASPHEVYEQPANLFVAGFIGTPPMNTFAAAVRDGVVAVGDDSLARPAGQRLPEGECVVGARPEHLTIVADGGLGATVVFHESLGHERHVHCRLANGDVVIVRQPASAAVPADGDTVRIAIDPDDLHLFDHHTGDRLDARAS